ncbi:uncharacterized protein LOC130737933 [Lotus japonicus]|uniref:uncharacterized protein LOC130737933 n=1 Tax=Lotus japonicus TaxID=34305 RepID=UPI002586A5A4|nr:uncharacterized protein LOC130737933 [Lotus japonicus]
MVETFYLLMDTREPTSIYVHLQFETILEALFPIQPHNQTFSTAIVPPPIIVTTPHCSAGSPARSKNWAPSSCSAWPLVVAGSGGFTSSSLRPPFAFGSGGGEILTAVKDGFEEEGFLGLVMQVQGFFLSSPAYVDHAFSISDEDLFETSYSVNNKPPIKQIGLAVSLLVFVVLGILNGSLMAYNHVGCDNAHGNKTPLFPFGFSDNP